MEFYENGSLGAETIHVHYFIYRKIKPYECTELAHNEVNSSNYYFKDLDGGFILHTTTCNICLMSYANSVAQDHLRICTV